MKLLELSSDNGEACPAMILSFSPYMTPILRALGSHGYWSGSARRPHKNLVLSVAFSVNSGAITPDALNPLKHTEKFPH